MFMKEVQVTSVVMPQYILTEHGLQPAQHPMLLDIAIRQVVAVNLYTLHPTGNAVALEPARSSDMTTGEG